MFFLTTYRYGPLQQLTTCVVSMIDQIEEVAVNIPTQAEVLANTSVYGDPRGRGGAVVSTTWYRNDIVMIHPPFPMHMGATPITRIPIHRFAAASLSRVLATMHREANGHLPTLKEWGVTSFGGTFNYRTMRGLTALSMHSYGCAIDLDPANNGLGDQTPRFALFPRVLKAFENEGWMWGGDWNGNGLTSDERRCDGMHWQLTRRAK